MPNPFPGMNPYMEQPSLWKPIHARIINALDQQIRAQIKPPFYCNIDARVYLALKEGVNPDIVVADREDTPHIPSNLAVSTLAPDIPLTIAPQTEEITEKFLEIRLAGRPGRLVTAIELLSPKNKSRESMGRDTYTAKQKEIIHSESSLLEIDLLRKGAYTLAAPYNSVKNQHPKPWHYGVCLHRGGEGEVYQVWLSQVRTRLPIITVPLTSDMPDLVVDLNRAVSTAYDDGSYDLAFDYNQEPTPSLSPEDALWLDELLRGQGLR